MSLDLDFVRSQFPALGGEWAFFDNAGGSQILKRSVDRISDFLLTRNVQTGGTYDVSVKAREAVEQSRLAVAMLINAARPEEVVMGPSTTALLQNLSRAMASQLSAGDEIIITNADHESNIGPWMSLQKQGVVIKTWQVNKQTFELDIDDLLPLFSARTRLVCVTHVSNLLGTINPIAEIARITHEHGARICVDAVAYAPHGAVDVTAWDVDYYAFSFYKVFGPHHAVLYGKYDHLLELDGLYHYFYGKEKVPQKLEPGNVNYELSCGAAGIVDYLIELGGKSNSAGSSRARIVSAFADIGVHERQIGERLLSYLRSRNDCRIIGRDAAGEGRVPTISFTINGRDSGEIAKSIDPFKVAVRFGDFHARRLAENLDLMGSNGAVRVSMAHYNTLAEVDRLIAAFDQTL
ncbi:cysteine desulfurase family protein (TIGR01976 family) [Devosia sp. UYZn731]|uniref:cysteine desulfurase-like protein n=1 Tax=Devosia sp. UYZn731 TaxID=3156345 RepID=UPI003390AB1B